MLTDQFNAFEEDWDFHNCFKMKMYLVRHIEGKCTSYTVVLCSEGKLQIEYISTCNRSLLCFPVSHFLWVTVRQQGLHGFVLLQGHLECRPVDLGPTENRCCSQLWAVWCWRVSPFQASDLPSVWGSYCTHLAEWT